MTPRDVDAWAALLGGGEIPVQAYAASALEELRAMEDDTDARLIAEAVGRDPLMTLKLLAHGATLGGSRRDGQAETVVETLVLSGITPFFRAFGPQPTAEAALAAHPEALAGLRAVIERADRAARFAAAFAVHRGDHDAVVLHEAAQLHDFAEMLLWLHAPATALEIARRQAADPALRSATVQRELLGVELNDVQQALMQHWRLPGILQRITDDRHADNSQVRTVLLAIRLARHTAHGWDNPAVPDDVRDIAALLLLGADATRSLLAEVDAAG